MMPKVEERRKCFIDVRSDHEFILLGLPTGNDSGAILGPITKNPVPFNDGTFVWSLNIGGCVRAKTMEEAAQKWAASKSLLWEIIEPDLKHGETAYTVWSKMKTEKMQG